MIFLTRSHITACCNISINLLLHLTLLIWILTLSLSFFFFFSCHSIIFIWVLSLFFLIFYKICELFASPLFIAKGIPIYNPVMLVLFCVKSRCATDNKNLLIVVCDNMIHTVGRTSCLESTFNLLNTDNVLFIRSLRWIMLRSHLI
jgi:hypothetical protein